MLSADFPEEPSLTPTTLDHTTSLFESDDHPTVHGAGIPKEHQLASTAITTSSFNSPGSKKVITWDGPDDPDNPKNWSYSYKWFVTLICSLLTLNVYVSLLPRLYTCINSPFELGQHVRFLSSV
jgi:hypothetical protein